VVDPGLALAIRGASGGTIQPVSWVTLLPLIADFWHIVCTQLDPKKRAGRLKQWLNFLRRRFPEAEVAYQALRTARDQDVDVWLAAELRRYGLAQNS